MFIWKYNIHYVHMYIKSLYMHSNSFDVHMIWLMSVFSLMQKGEIVGIKLLLPLVTTLSLTSTIIELITLYSSHRVLQCKPSSHSIYRVTTRHMKISSVYRALSTSGNAMVTQYSPRTLVSTELRRQYEGNTVFTKF